jgi:hypothetical protein
MTSQRWRVACTSGRPRASIRSVAGQLRNGYAPYHHTPISMRAWGHGSPGSCSSVRFPSRLVLVPGGAHPCNGAGVQGATAPSSLRPSRKT